MLSDRFLVLASLVSSASRKISIFRVLLSHFKSLSSHWPAQSERYSVVLLLLRSLFRVRSWLRLSIAISTLVLLRYVNVRSLVLSVSLSLRSFLISLASSAHPTVFPLLLFLIHI